MDSVSRTAFNVHHDKLSRISTETNEVSHYESHSQANYLTEEEALSLLQNHQLHLDRVKIENEELKKRIEETLQKKIEIDKEFANARSENIALKKETLYYQDSAKEWDEKLRQKEKEIATEEKSKIDSYMSIVEFDTKQRCQEIIETSACEENHKEQLLAFLASYQECKDNMKQLLGNYEMILKENDTLQGQINELVGNKESMKICIKCKENFIAANNNENSCLFHPGSLKYYSCRKCGADEYWSCCNQCRSCLRGCRKGKHISVQ